MNASELRGTRSSAKIQKRRKRKRSVQSSQTDLTIESLNLGRLGRDYGNRQCTTRIALGTYLLTNLSPNAQVNSPRPAPARRHALQPTSHLGSRITVLRSFLRPQRRVRRQMGLRTRVVRPFPFIVSLVNTTRPLIITLNHYSHTTILVLITAIRCLLCRTLGPSIPVDPVALACKRLTSRTFLPHEVISLIEAIFTSQDEVKAIGYLRGDDAQTFIDVIHMVRIHVPSFPRRARLIASVGCFSSHLLLIRLWIFPISHHGSGGSV